MHSLMSSTISTTTSTASRNLKPMAAVIPTQHCWERSRSLVSITTPLHIQKQRYRAVKDVLSFQVLVRSTLEPTEMAPMGLSGVWLNQVMERLGRTGQRRQPSTQVPTMSI